MQTIDRQWFTVKDFAKLHGLSRALIYQNVRNGAIPYIRLRGKILVPSDALDLLLENKNLPESK